MNNRGFPTGTCGYSSRLHSRSRVPGSEKGKVVTDVIVSSEEASESPQALASFVNLQSTHPPGGIIGRRRDGILVDEPVWNGF